MPPERSEGGIFFNVYEGLKYNQMIHYQMILKCLIKIEAYGIIQGKGGQGGRRGQARGGADDANIENRIGGSGGPV